MDGTALLVRTALAEHFRFSKAEIAGALESHFARKARDLEHVGPWGPDVALRLDEFVASGKMIRGALVLLASELFGRPRDGEELKVAAAVELLQSALLVHDDIMDRDRYRRGRESVYSQYATLGEMRGVAEPLHFGQSMGICAGDVAIFTAFELLGSLTLETIGLSKIMSLVTREMTYVGVAQMQDVYHGQAAVDVAERDVYVLYLYKTGRYTFALPLMLGGLIADAPPGSLDSLAKLGETLGVLFQMKDDEIGLFGNSQEIGKPWGSDVREGKKTFYYLHLMRDASPEQRSRLAAVFGNKGAGPEEICYVRELVERLGIRKSLSGEMGRLAEKAHAIADQIDGVDPNRLELVHELVDFNLKRET